VWSQQGAKITVSPVSAPLGWYPGTSLSADGNTLSFSNPFDSSNHGAIWVWVRSGSTWSQQTKLIPTGTNIPSPYFGNCADLSDDGNTLVTGAVSVKGLWVFVRSGTAWTQQASGLVSATGVTSDTSFLAACSVSADGNRAILGNPRFVNGGAYGGAWIFQRSGTTWSQLGTRLYGTSGGGDLNYQGERVAISGDGYTAVTSKVDRYFNSSKTWIFDVNS